MKTYDLTLKQALYDENERVSVPDEIWHANEQINMPGIGTP